MSDHDESPPADPSATPADVDAGVSRAAEPIAVRSGLRGWHLTGSLAALAGAGALAWAWLFGAWSDRESAPGARVSFTATAYCKGTTTAAGTAVRRGIAAADRDVLPSGSVVSLSTGDPDFDGVYTVLDTGPAVQGRILDLYVWSCNEALAFGRRKVSATILRMGWDPRDSAPTLTDRLLHRKPRRHEPTPEEAAAEREKIPSAPKATAPSSQTDGAAPSLDPVASSEEPAAETSQSASEPGERGP